MSTVQQLLIACPFIFIAGFIDSIAGGGGLISLPTFYLIGLPPLTAMGTNKLSASMGAFVSAFQYVKAKYIYKEVILISVIMALLGSYLGTRTSLLVDEIYLKYIMIILVPIIAIATVCKKDLLNKTVKQLPLKKANILAAVTTFAIGFYDGFFGPGTGMFLMLVYVTVLGMNIVTACGNTKVVNLCTNLASIVAFLSSDKIVYHLAIPCGISCILGSYFGSKLAMKKGIAIIKPIMLVVIALLMLSVGKDVFTTLFLL